MDTLRGTFDPDAIADRGWDASDDDGPDSSQRRDLPPHAIGQDERRMQVRAYNHWASLLGERIFPNIEDLDPETLPDFGPHSVLLDFSSGIDNPAVCFLGAKLGQECGATGVITRLSDVPPRSLLSRITDHYMQILANQAPIGFEAEFVNHAGVAILYRGILLPYSSDDSTIDFIYGVINWKEMADQLTADELLLEIDQALELGAELELAAEPALRPADPVTDWADSPAHESADDGIGAEQGFNDFDADSADTYGDDFASLTALDGGAKEGLRMPDFSQFGLGDDDEEYDEDEGEGELAGYNFASLADYIEAPTKKAIDLTGLEPLPEDEQLEEPDFGAADFGPEPVAEAEPEPAIEAAPVFTPVAPIADPVAEDDDFAEDFADDLPDDAGLYDCLAAARELARAADSTEDRSRNALYAAVSRAYDFSLAAEAAPEDYAELIAESGLTVQDRAPMTPVVKLVFGHDYDKTRLTEYAAVLTHAHRLQLERGSLSRFLAEVEGGVKAVVKAERRLRREEQGKPVEDAAAVREALAQQLRALDAISLEHLDGAGPEFALVLIRRDEIGCAEILAEVPEDLAQIERAARKLFG
ncbi:hypothetical protein [uncultured Erythrobacter sp.]|uniref:hypothetical protein n=1 Tax=uncultured Erythrobacter sp. TaxID=263913 RepID=UPI0026599F6F|nr:hypothetical protein [uncultured Erythrobacter sp.]